MADLNYLDSDEVRLIEIAETYKNDTRFMTHKGDLILTNKNVIWVKKNIAGFPKSFEKYPLSELKIYDGKPQVGIVSKFGDYPALTFSFRDYEQSFKLILTQKIKAKEIITRINKMITNTASDVVEEKAIPGTAFVAETLKGTINTFKKSFGIKEKEAACQCPSCAATIRGIVGQVIECPYCGTSIKLG